MGCWHMLTGLLLIEWVKLIRVPWSVYQDHNEEADVYAAHDHDDHEACWY